MKVTNKSKKIIGIGAEAVLPSATIELPANFENSPVVKSMLRRGQLHSDTIVATENTAVVDETIALKKALAEANARADAAEALLSKADEAPADEAPADEAPADEAPAEKTTGKAKSTAKTKTASAE